MSTLELQNFYPDFVPNQILTNTQLNNLRDFLDEQNRLTRTRLIGMGIACGLQGRLNNDNSITISEGFGISSHGYLIELPETKYTRFRSYVDPYIEVDENGHEFPEYEPWRTPALPYEQIDLWELLSEETLADIDFEEDPDNVSAPITKAILKDKVLVLYYELLEENLKSCLVTDCNNKGMNLRINVRALLVNKDDLDKIPACPGPETTLVAPNLISGLKKNGVDGLPAVTSVSQIDKGYKTSAEFISSSFLAEIQNVYDEYKELLQLSESTDAQVSGLNGKLTAILGQASFNQYHYDFFVDLATAYNEFVKQVCHLIKNCCPDGNYPKHLALRDFTTSGSSLIDTGEYRNVFDPSPVRDAYYHDVAKTRRLFLRMLSIVDHFNVVEGETIKITPSQIEEYSLGRRALPFYYTSNGLNKLWQPEECCTTAPLLSYHSNAMKQNLAWPGDLSYPANPLGLNLNFYSMYRIEGHINKACDVVHDELSTLKKTFNLEFDLIKLNVQKEAGNATDPELIEIENLLKQIEDIEKQIRDLIEDDFAKNMEEILALFQEIELIRKEVVAINTGWQEKRVAIQAPCNISHLQEDYLILRSEVLCSCAKIQAALVDIPDIDLTPPKKAIITFDELQTGTKYGNPTHKEGDLIFTENEIPVTVEFFTWGNGQGTFNSAQVDPASANFGTDKIMRANNINFKFDFSKLDFTPNQVTFEFMDLGGNENISVNGSQLFISNLTSAPADIAPGVKFSVTTRSVQGGTAGIVTLTGAVQTLLVGGQEFWIDNVEASASDENIKGFTRESLKARDNELKKRITSTEAELKKVSNEMEKRNLALRKFSLEKEKATIHKMETLSDNSHKLVHEIYVSGAGMNAISQPAELTVAGGNLMQAGIKTDNPLTLLVWGLLFGITQLKAQAEALCKMFPKDLRAFNYPLFIKSYKEILGLINQLRLLVSLLLELLIVASSSYQPLVKYMQGELWKVLLGKLPQISDYLNAYNSILYKCVHAQLATVYYSLEYLLNKQVTFAEFAAKNPGMVHLAGVEKGGTFIMVCEEKSGQKRVLADFALRGKTSCCCPLDPEELCLPPIAMPEYRVVEVVTNDKAPKPIDEWFDVVKNDIDLNGSGNLELSLPSEESLLGGKLSIDSPPDSDKKMIRYINENNILYGIDSFEYELIDKGKCDMKDTGEVLILIKEKSAQGIVAMEDMAVTPKDTPVDIDVALNDILGSPILNASYSLSVSSPPVLTTSTVEVVTNSSGRQLFRFRPEAGFVGRDMFYYEVNVGGRRSLGMVTVLVISCCNESPIKETIVGTRFQGIVLGEGEPLPGVNIIVKGTTTGSVTDMGGKFVLGEFPEGPLTLQISFAGFQSRELYLVVEKGGPDQLPEPIHLVALGRPARGNFTIVTDDLKVITRKLAENTDITVAENKVLELYSARFAEKEAAIRNTAVETGLENERAYLAAEEFMVDVIADPELDLKATTKSYEKVTGELIKAYDAATGSAKKAYKDIITATSHAYLDKVTIKNPEGLSAAAVNSINKVTEKMKESDISPIGIRNSWSGKDLESELKIEVIKEVNGLLK